LEETLKSAIVPWNITKAAKLRISNKFEPKAIFWNNRRCQSVTLASVIVDGR
jgi:hypothetical protein